MGQDTPTKISLPLLDALEEQDKSFLVYSSNELKLNDLIGYTVPKYINENLFHTMRYYQEDAIRYFHYTRSLPDFRNSNHFLFNMATGSGKTDLMAALILYLYEEQNYKCFLFIVNSNPVLNKTIDNLTDPTSKKYLLNKEIVINGETITIRKVNVFPTVPADNTIYVKLSTVQAVVNDLYIPKENAMDREQYSKNKTVILGDEAHHYSATTKSEKEEEGSWEVAINNVLAAHKDNLLLEFTATIDLDDKRIYNKYRDKVIYRYPLNEFMRDGYSKNVKRIESPDNDKEKMLSVVLLSQYRKYFAEKLGIATDFKPVVFFKSSRIAVSNWAEKTFNEIISNLTVEELDEFISTRIREVSKDSETLNMAFTFYKEHSKDLGKILLDIQEDFQPRNVINANDSDRGAAMLEKGQYMALNSLDQPDNLYRVIFAVGKLTEGWDVLNLYDIVRLNESAKTDKKSTMSEAQLIGRGARYYPFKLNGELSYKRRFEDDSQESLILETLHYHTINEPQYLINLVNSLKEMDFPTGSDAPKPKLDVQLKKEFKNSNTWKYGKLYYNKTVVVEDDFYEDISKYGIDNVTEVTIKLLTTSKETVYNELSENRVFAETLVTWNDSYERERFFKKAINKNPFYRFNNLKKILPIIDSINDFLFSEKWLNINNLHLRVESESEIILTPKVKLDIIMKYLEDIKTKLQYGYQRERGTNEFIGYPIKEYVNNYRKAVPKIDTLHSTNVMQIVEPRDMTGKHYYWYPYKLAILNRLEFKLIERIHERISHLEQGNREVFLIRMDEQMNRETIKSEKLKLHQFDGSVGINGHLTFSGFQPDFVLTVLDANYFYQIFIEPKDGSSVRMAREQWKEDLLLYISEHNSKLVIDEEVDNIIIKGLKFFTNNDTRKSIKQLEDIFGLDSDISII